jgi:hypothetical protein
VAVGNVVFGEIKSVRAADSYFAGYFLGCFVCFEGTNKHILNQNLAVVALLTFPCGGRA